MPNIIEYWKKKTLNNSDFVPFVYLFTQIILLTKLMSPLFENFFCLEQGKKNWTQINLTDKTEYWTNIPESGFYSFCKRSKARHVCDYVRPYTEPLLRKAETH